MKIIKRNLVALSLITITAFSVNAQTTSKISTKSQTTINTEESDYMSIDFEKKIKARLISGEIPASLPKYTKGATQEDYVKILKTWGKENLRLIKKEYHVQILGKNKRPESQTK